MEIKIPKGRESYRIGGQMMRAFLLIVFVAITGCRSDKHEPFTEDGKAGENLKQTPFSLPSPSPNPKPSPLTQSAGGNVLQNIYSKSGQTTYFVSSNKQTYGRLRVKVSPDDDPNRAKVDVIFSATKNITKKENNGGNPYIKVRFPTDSFQFDSMTNRETHLLNTANNPTSTHDFFQAVLNEMEGFGSTSGNSFRLHFTVKKTAITDGSMAQSFNVLFKNAHASDPDQFSSKGDNKTPASEFFLTP